MTSEPKTVARIQVDRSGRIDVYPYKDNFFTAVSVSKSRSLDNPDILAPAEVSAPSMGYQTPEDAMLFAGAIRRAAMIAMEWDTATRGVTSWGHFNLLLNPATEKEIKEYHKRVEQESNARLKAREAK